MRWRVLTGVWMVIVLVGSLLPPGVGGRGGDIWHLLGFGVLTLLLTVWMPVGMSAGVAWAYGVLLEGMQWLTRYRDAEARDLLVNAAGVAVGLLAWAVLRRGVRR